MSKNCKNCGNCKAGFCTDSFRMPIYAADFCANWTKRKAMTNGDRLRMMTDEELAQLLDGKMCGLCVYEQNSDDCVRNACSTGVKAWLKQEAKDA